MRTPAPTLLPLLRSQRQGELLALLFLHPDREYTLTEVADILGTNVKAVHAEAERLVGSGILHDRRVGPARLLRAATDTILARPLTDLLAVTFGPVPVLNETLPSVHGVIRAFIFGSWAARYCGEPGPVPNDVDVLVVGDADLDDLDVVARTAEDVLRRSVNVRRVREVTWLAPEGTDPFLDSIRQAALVELRAAASTPSAA